MPTIASPKKVRVTKRSTRRLGLELPTAGWTGWSADSTGMSVPFFTPGSFERMQELSPKIHREVAFTIAKVSWYFTRWHVKRAKCDIENRKRRGEILVEPRLLRGV